MLDTQSAPKDTLARELGQSVVLLALTGSSVAGMLAMVEVATRALGR
jgi:hypothetical protein